LATLNLRRFTDSDALKTIQIKYLIDLLKPYENYLSGRGIKLTERDFNYKKLAVILIDTDEDTPVDLINTFYFIHEMSDEDGLDDLLQAAEARGLSVSSDDDSSPADIAVQVWLQDSKLLERKHAERSLCRPRTFEYFQAVNPVSDNFQIPDEALTSLEKNLDDWFSEKRRGRGTRVFKFDRDNEVCFLIRHGQPFRREGQLVKGQSSSIYYRPEKHDVLIYDKVLNELRINTDNKGIKAAYLMMFGKHLFNNPDYFTGANKYTLEPLRIDGENSLVCSDVAGLESVRLKELHIQYECSEREIEIRKAPDVFRALSGRNAHIPSDVQLVRAGFTVRFLNAKTTRTLTICAGNIVQYSRDEDSICLEEWMLKRGFIISNDNNITTIQNE
jgi:hypothetical protein